jgi:DNA polymerase III delta prime subunit
MISLENIKSIIVNNVTNYSLLLLGEPGIGKSTIVKEAAKEIAEKMGKEFIEMKIAKDSDIKSYADIDKIIENKDKYYVFVDIRLSSIEPADLQGIPDMSKEYFVYKAPAWAYVLKECSGMLFLDEITACNRDDILSAAFQLVLDRRSGECYFNDNVTIIAAGNNPKESSVARLLPSPLTNRFAIFEIEAPKVEDWVKYMDNKYDEEKINKLVIGFLLSNKDIFREIPKESETLNQYPTPRTWEQLALALCNFEHVSKNEKAKYDLIASFVGKEAATRFKAFVDLESKIKLDELIQDPDKIYNLTMSEKLMVFLLLANKASDLKTKKKLMEMIDPLYELLSRVTFVKEHGEEVIYYEYLWFFIYMFKKKNWRSIIVNELSKRNPRFYTITAEVLKHSIRD